MSPYRRDLGEAGREDPRVYEEEFKAEAREAFKKLLQRHLRFWKEVHPLIQIQEKYLGYDDAIQWEGEPLVLGPVLPLQSCIELAPPTLLQYKIPLSEPGLVGLVFPISTSQYLLMRAHQISGESAYYALSKVRTRNELQDAKDDLFRLAILVKPVDLGINDFSYDEYRLHVETGKWFMKPNQSTLLPVPLDPDPARIAVQMEKARARLGLPRSVPRSPANDPFDRSIQDIKRSILKIRQPGFSADIWRNSEIKDPGSQ